MAKRSGDKWFVGVMNNSIGKSVDLNLSFLPSGNYEAEMWSDTKNSDKEPKELKKAVLSIKSPGTIKVTMAKDGGFVALIRSKNQ
jgi:alpha-glucosidase